MQPSAHIFCTQSKVCLLPTPPYAQWIHTYVHITHLNTSTRPHVTSTSCSGSYVGYVGQTLASKVAPGQLGTSHLVPFS